MFRLKHPILAKPYSLLIMTVVAALFGCQSLSDRGWVGSGAEPFDAARAACQTKTKNESDADFETCMASKGWRRPER